MYLNNLAKLRKSNLHGIEPEQCPVCTENLGPHQVLLLCGHSFCVDCTLAMIKRYRNTMKCPTCRSRANLNEISYVVDNLLIEREQKFKEQEKEFEVIGNALLEMIFTVNR